MRKPLLLIVVLFFLGSGLLIWQLQSPEPAPVKPAPVPAANTSPPPAPTLKLPVFSNPVTLEEVREAGAKYSPKAIARGLIDQDDGRNWKLIIDKIAAGNADWIAVGGLYIFPGTESGSAEDCIFALTDALVTNPEAVLGLNSSWRDNSLDLLCDYPFFDVEYSYIQEYSRKAIAAVSKVKNSDLREKRDFCLKTLKEGKAEIDKMYREGRWNVD